MAILFWFYKNPEVTADRLMTIRRINIHVPVFGLYGGHHREIEQFRIVTSQLDDLWLHPEVSGEWAWCNGDLMLANWYEERGIQLPWSSIFIYQWDLLLARPTAHLFISDPQEIILPDVRPLEEVASNWIWVQPWSKYYPTFQAFCAHPLVRGRILLASVFILANVSRRFFEDYARTVRDVPGLLEYRLPTLASALGYRFRSCDLYPDWGDCGDPLLNGCQRVVTREQIQDSYREKGSWAWHPVYDLAPLKELLTLVPPIATTRTNSRVAILQVPPARPGVVAGGAQAVADTLARGLVRSDHDVFVFAGTNDAVPASWINDGVHYRSAFRITRQLLEGEAEVSFFPGDIDLLRRCRMAFMFDRVFTVPEGVETILFLGTTAYTFARLAALSSGWHSMIVPSTFVYQEVVCLLANSGQGDRVRRVKVVPNPVDPADLGLLEPLKYRVRTGNKLRLLFPHRGDPGKGLEAALRLLGRLKLSCDVTLVAVVDTSPTAEQGFYSSLLEAARSIGVLEQLDLTPWLPRAQMHSLYASADLTLCLGQITEGFGLVCLESILCGTPVLARKAGAQTDLLPSEHGCFIAPEDEDEMVRLVRDLLFTSSLPEQLRRGADLIRQKFSTDAFIAGVRAVAGLQGECS